MRDRDRERDSTRTLARNALRKAAGGTQPDMSGLLAAVPSLMSQARRLERPPAPLGYALTIAAGARRALPILAAATLVVLALTGAALLLDRKGAENASMNVDAVVMNGAENGVTGDLLLDAVIGEGGTQRAGVGLRGVDGIADQVEWAGADLDLAPRLDSQRAVTGKAAVQASEHRVELGQ